MMKPTELSFYDHHRQSYGYLPIDNEAEFRVGDYGDNSGGVGDGGEFKISLIRLGREKPLSPHLEVFGDATDSLRAAIDAGLLETLTSVSNADEFSRRLIGLGLRDASECPVDSRRPWCPCCKRPLPDSVERSTDV